MQVGRARIMGQEVRGWLRCVVTQMSWIGGDRVGLHKGYRRNKSSRTRNAAQTKAPDGIPEILGTRLNIGRGGGHSVLWLDHNPTRYPVRSCFGRLHWLSPFGQAHSSQRGSKQHRGVGTSRLARLAARCRCPEGLPEQEGESQARGRIAAFVEVL